MVDQIFAWDSLGCFVEEHRPPVVSWLVSFMSTAECPCFLSRLDEEDYGGHVSLLAEGFAQSLGLFMVSLVLSAPACNPIPLAYSSQTV